MSTYRAQALRILDANINRAKEGLRVCEDIMRLVIEDKAITAALKATRHRIQTIIAASKLPSAALSSYRQSLTDIGKTSKPQKKQTMNDIFSANAQRVKEALRVLEEVAGLFDSSVAGKFQRLRFTFYDIEKKSLTKIRNLRNR